jgi:hypothetical protein
VVLRAGLEPARITPHAPQTCAATNYATSAFGCKGVTRKKIEKNYFFLLSAGFGASFFGSSFLGAAFAFAGLAAFALAGAGFPFASEGTSTKAVFPLVAVFEFASAVLAFAVFEFASAAGAAGCSAVVVESTETPPVRAGIESKSADTIKQAAAVIVIFDKTVCVPRGLKAELEILLVKSAPASVLPGCSSTDAISAMQDKKNIPYKI